MKLDVQYRAFSCRLTRPLRTANGDIEERSGFLIRISDGTDTGYGEATPLAGWTESTDACRAALDDAVDAASNGQSAVLDAVDDTAAARHGISLALGDLAATRDANPLYRDLGALERVPRIPVNATIGDGSPSETVDAVERAVDDGFSCCKLKVGRDEVDEDIDRIRRVRDAVGPDVDLRVDANGAWTFDEAERALDELDDLGVSILEQPLPAGALSGLAELRGNGVAIAVDEGLLEHGVDAIESAQAADVYVLKPMALGGVDVARRVAAWVAESNRSAIVTTTIDAVVARTAAVHLAAAIPNVLASGVATGDRLADDLARDPVFIDGGTAVIPQTKGLGVENVWTEP
ncbi:enolase superfamily enzyme related to L-alanine-DL-glutamate epimerase [Halovivax ruber XH-70]|uniref:o-succinylbenzoate synthase n=1 Tax=Halovivax ruber (strain DSM 18193 / JCM 13892 / XH-70) TaxID=797302 RepID=L0IDA8_HALRX|nr:o-succinylbenzoate synthase [Halovivax ruber]AGB15947.1 enolase superfamily enzyme related to L-alanine-DL-glutamate epimerase [Halovivax ruber XH-70]